jgi:hypothetical protein
MLVTSIGGVLPDPPGVLVMRGSQHHPHSTPRQAGHSRRGPATPAPSGLNLSPSPLEFKTNLRRTY